MNNIEDNSKYSCSGCGACAAVCPVNAIEYKLNENGFFQAFVNEDKCIHCGKCKRVCKRFFEENKFGKSLEKGKVYSAQSTNNDTIKKCTSGGIAYEISKYGIENGYKIIGTAYDYDNNMANTIVVDKIEELEKLRGSKYIQSNTANAYRSMLEICKNDKESKFIVFGTPCQIAGVNKIQEVNNIKNEIIKIELFCHGVPSYLVWKNYLKFLKEKHGIDEIKDITFRNKDLSWHKYYMNIKSKNGNSYLNHSDKDIFYKAFLDNILLNTSCQTCEFRKKYSMADIRIGDYWGKRYSNREDGVSAILIMNDIGKELIENVEQENKIKIIEETSVSECINAQSIKDYQNQELRTKAFDELKNGKSLKKVIKNYRNKMPLKTRMRYFAKDVARLLPKKIKNKIKYIVKK